MTYDERAISLLVNQHTYTVYIGLCRLHNLIARNAYVIRVCISKYTYDLPDLVSCVKCDGGTNSTTEQRVCCARISVLVALCITRASRDFVSRANQIQRAARYEQFGDHPSIDLATVSSTLTTHSAKCMG